MNSRPRSELLLPIGLAVCAVVTGLWMVFRSLDGIGFGKGGGESRFRDEPAGTTMSGSGPGESPPGSFPDLSNALLDVLREKLDVPFAKENEALLTFSDPEALADFLRLAEQAGLSVTGPLEGAPTIQVSYGSLDQLRDALAAHRGEQPLVDANYLVGIPNLSTAPPAGGVGTEPFETSLMASLGITEGTDRATWGAGVTVAVIDSGILPHPAFREGQVVHLDLTEGGGGLHAHGTAMASLVAGALPGAEGLAPGADILDIRIAGSDGLSDSYRLARGIHSAIERGAGVINISMAAYGDARPVAEAVAEAVRRGIIVVAAVGNDGAAMKAWPAAYPGVVSVSGVAADGSLAYFSNTGSPTLAAPSVGVPSAYHDGATALLGIGNGTSQAAALVSGAAAMYRSQGLDVMSALTARARPGNATPEAIGAGILHLVPLEPPKAR